MLGQSPPKDILDEFKKECMKTNICGHFANWPPNWDLYNKCMDNCISDKIKQWQTTTPSLPPSENSGNGGNGENGGNGLFKAGFPVMPIAIGVSALMVTFIIYILVRGRKK